MAFRGAAKSTISEEALTLGACYRDYHNAIILGETYHRAVERLTAIKHELETNEYIEFLFGDLVGPTWTENKIVLNNGVIIQAFGRGQSLRGSKHLDWRPDIAFADDVEDEESCSDEAAIEKTKRWLFSVVKPALDPDYRMRVNGTPLHPHSVLMQLAADPDWAKLVVPIEYVDPEGQRQSSWPGRFPIDAIEREKQTFARHGMQVQYQQEYMCQSEDPASKPFKTEMMRVEPVVRTWHAVYAMYDPARSVSKTSASTGKVVWSWTGSRLIVWDAGAYFWKPDELINDLFSTDAEYNPVEIFIEEDGLNEWLMQPIRGEMLKRSWMLPVAPVKAPRGKHQFIEALQPYFKAGEIVFAKPMPELVSQLLSFPTGRIDAPNALAYALRLRPGAPVYDGFTHDMVAESLAILPRAQVYLAVNANLQYTAGALVQYVKGGLHVIADFLQEGEPSGVLGDLVKDASLVGGRFTAVAGPEHFADKDLVGLRGAASRVPLKLDRGGSIYQGRDELHALMKQTIHGRPALMVSSQARWTLNALSGGYCFEKTKHGTAGAFTKLGPYRVLMEGLETLAARMHMGADDQQRVYATSPDGRKYLTTLGGQAEMRPSKSDWSSVLSDNGRRS